MINFDKRDLVKIIKNKRSNKIIMSNKLALDFDIINDFITIRLIYNNKIIASNNLMYLEDIDETISITLLKVNYLFDSFLKYNQVNDEILILKKCIHFLIKKIAIFFNEDLLIKSFNDMIIISIQSKDNKNTKHIISLLSLEDEKINLFSKIFYNSNKELIYNPYEFIIKNDVFSKSDKNNEIINEIIYYLS